MAHPTGSVRSLRHAGIVVASLERTLPFYRDLLGLSVSKDMVECGPFVATILGFPEARVRTVKLAFPEGQPILELLEFEIPAPERLTEKSLVRPGPTHVALNVENIDSLYARLSKAGVTFTCAPQTSPDGGARVTFCLDPEGNPLELVELV